MLFGGDVGDADGVGHGGLITFVFGVSDFGEGDAGAGFDDGVSEDTGDQFDGAGRVVVGRDGEVDGIRIIGGVAEGEHGDAELVGFGDGVVLEGRIDEDHGLRELTHFLDAAEVLVELGEFLLEEGDLFLREAVPGAIGLLGLEFTKPLDAGGDGAEVGEGSAEPTVGDVEGARADGFINHDLLGLGFGSDEEDLATAFDDGAEGLVGSIGALDRLVEVDDVDAVAGAIDELAHLGVPATGLVSEVDAGF